MSEFWFWGRTFLFVMDVWSVLRSLYDWLGWTFTLFGYFGELEQSKRIFNSFIHQISTCVCCIVWWVKLSIVMYSCSTGIFIAVYYFIVCKNYMQNKLFLSMEIFMMIREVQGKWFSDAFKNTYKKTAYSKYYLIIRYQYLDNSYSKIE